MIEPVADQHGWVENGGTETPVSRITLDGSEYVVLSGCKPHDCAAENLVTLLRPGGDAAVGALAVNRGDTGFGPKRSTLTWLSEPDREQRRFIAAYSSASGCRPRRANKASERGSSVADPGHLVGVETDRAAGAADLGGGGDVAAHPRLRQDVDR